MYELPTTVTIEDTEYKIRKNADFRLIIKIIATCQDKELTPEEQTISALLLFYEDANSVADVFTMFSDLEAATREMMDFIGLYKKDIGHQMHYKVIDWVADEMLIISAINEIIKCELREIPYMHWWTLVSYFMAIKESSLSTVVGIREKIYRHKKLMDYEKEFKMKNPEYFMLEQPKTLEQQEIEKVLDKLWKRGDK